MRDEIARLSLKYLRDVLKTASNAYGEYRVQEGELIFVPKKNARIPADRLSEWSVSKTASGGKIRFLDKASAIALARSIGVFQQRDETAGEDLSDEAVFGADEE